MSQYLQPANGIPQPYELIEDLATALTSLAILDSALSDASGNGGKENVYAHRLPTPKPSGDGWILVRERLDAGGRQSTASGLQKVVIQLSVEAQENVENVDQFLAAVQNRLSEFVLSMWSPVPTKSDIAVQARRVTEPTPARWDDASRSWYSIAEYAVTIAPFSS